MIKQQYIYNLWLNEEEKKILEELIKQYKKQQGINISKADIIRMALKKLKI